MELTDFKFITDENIQTKVIDYLTILGLDIFDIKQMRLQGTSDHKILDLAVHENRIIITQDSDFGTDFFTSGIQATGIIYIRPGHVNSSEVIKILDAILNEKIDIEIPFIIVAELIKNKVKIRIRKLYFDSEKS
jgi:predicted nuclease of predicted toxin-antitoxin system